MKLNIKPVRQGGSVKLGFGGYSMRSSGCYLACLFSTLKFFGKDYSTLSGLNDVAKRLKGFKAGTSLIDGEAFAKAFGYKFGGIEAYKNTPAPVDLIRKRIDDGLPTIIKVDSDKVKVDVQAHFCLVKGYTENDLIINDPWTGEEYFLTAKYPHKNNAWNKPEYIIYGLRRYDPLDQKPPENSDPLVGKDEEIERLRQQLSSSETIRKDLASDNEELRLKIKKINNQGGLCQSKLKTANDILAKSVEQLKVAGEMVSRVIELKKQYKRLYENALNNDITKKTGPELFAYWIRKLLNAKQ